MSLQKRGLHYIKKHRMWKPEDRVCIAVSGGIDSMVLMHVLHRTQRAHGANLEVCTIDHQLRPESKNECQRVLEEAAKMGLKAYVHRLEIAVGGNLYERARQARQQVLQALGCVRIATGHHQKDQAETLLYRLLRGSGLQGLAGMRPIQAPWCRPLLFAEKEQLYQYAKRNDIWWVEDPSNAHSLRGSLRTIFPLLDSLHGSAAASIARSAELLAADSDLLERYTREAWERTFANGVLQRIPWEKEWEEMRFRLLKNLFVFYDIPIRYNIIAAFVAHPSRMQLPKGGWIDIDNTKIWVVSGSTAIQGED